MSTTRRTLRWLLGGLLALTMLTAAGGLAVFASVQSTTRFVRDTAPAVAGLSAAHLMLIDAHAEAVRSTVGSETRLGGTGEEFSQNVTLAGESLARAAQVGGPAEAERLRHLPSLFGTYQTMVGRSGAEFRRQDAVMGTTDLWYASQLMDEAISTQLTELRDTGLRQVDDAAGGATPLADGVWLVPGVLLVGLLVVTQRFLARRFRRTWNPSLVAATIVVVIGLGGLAVHLVDARADLAWTRQGLDGEVADQTFLADAAEAEAETALRQLLYCVEEWTYDGCGPTVQRWHREGAGQAPAQRPLSGRRLEQRTLTDTAGRGEWSFLLPAAGVLVAALIAAGLLPRLDEYRFRSG